MRNLAPSLVKLSEKVIDSRKKIGMNQCGDFLTFRQIELFTVLQWLNFHFGTLEQHLDCGACFL